MRIEVKGQQGSTDKHYYSGIRDQDGKSFGIVKSGAGKVKTTPKLSPGQNRSKEKSPKQGAKWEGYKGLQREDSESGKMRSVIPTAREGVITHGGS